MMRHLVFDGAGNCICPGCGQGLSSITHDGTVHHYRCGAEQVRHGDEWWYGPSVSCLQRQLRDAGPGAHELRGPVAVVAHGPDPEGVSLSFFVGAIRHLTKIHGERYAQLPSFELFRAALARAEKLWESLPRVEQKITSTQGPPDVPAT